MKVTIKYDPDHKLAKRYFLEPASRLDGIQAGDVWIWKELSEPTELPPIWVQLKRLLTLKHKSK